VCVRPVSTTNRSVECELEVHSPENGDAGRVGEQAASGPVATDVRINPVDLSVSADDVEQLYSVIPDEPTSDSEAAVYCRPGSRGYYEGMLMEPGVERLRRSLVAPVYDRLNQTAGGGGGGGGASMGCKADTLVKSPYMIPRHLIPARRFRNTL